MAAVDMYLFDEAGKIVEHWDVVQTVPSHSPNPNDMFVKLYEDQATTSPRSPSTAIKTGLKSLLTLSQRPTLGARHPLAREKIF